VSFERDEMLPSDSSVSSSKASKKKASAGFGALPGSSARLSAGKEKGTVLASNLQPQAGEYTKEKLLELQRNTIRLGGAKPPSADSSKPLAEPVVVLKGLVKPPAVPHVENLETKMVPQSIDGQFGSIRLQDASLRSKDVESFGQDGVENKASAIESSRLNAEKGNDAENRLGLMGIGSGAEGGGVTHIPDAAAIAAAKAKRERLRQAQSAPDYIPVDSADFRGKSRESTGLDQEKDRNVSSDDEDGDSMVRIAMMGELPSGKKTRGGVFESVEEKFEERNGDYRRDDDEEEEEEERRWEEEQLRKGFGKRVDDSTTNWPQSTQFVHGQDAMTYLPSNPLPRSAWGFGGQSMEAMTISQKAHVCFTTLQETLQRTKVTIVLSQG
jgi:GC-rich sequence DNA-binding factor